MTQQYNTYQLRALKQLADFRTIFYDERKNLKTDSLKKSINSFIELFCQHHFANSDYSDIQKRPKKFTTTDQWISEFDIDTILKWLTYYIWTNKSNEGYLVRKIKDKTVYKLLLRLNEILSDQYKQIKIQNTNVILVNPLAKRDKHKL